MSREPIDLDALKGLNARFTRLPAEIADVGRGQREVNELRAQREAAAIGRERDMLAAMQTMRELAERGEKRQRAADAREAKMLRLAVAGVT